jgi:hypothetical protein
MQQWTYSFIDFNFGTICKFSTSRFCHVTRRDRPRVTRRIGGWVGPRTSVDVREKRKTLPLRTVEPKSQGCPPRGLVAITTKQIRLLSACCTYVQYTLCVPAQLS